MNLNYLKIFDRVAKTLNFSKAAEELYLSQPTVSIQIKKLEEEMSIKLFEQLGKKIYLTEAGNALFHYSRKIFNIVEEAQSTIDNLKGLASGKLFIGASTTPGIYILPRILGIFKKTFPGVEIILVINNTKEIEQKLLSHELELAFVGEDGKCSSELKSKVISQDNLVLVVGEDHPLAKAAFVSLSDVLKENFILREPGSSTRTALEERVKTLGLKLKIAMQFDSLEAIKQAVAANLGLSVLSQYVIDQELCTGKLKVLNIPELKITRNIHLIYHKDKKLSEPSQAFLRILKEEIAPKCS